MASARRYTRRKSGGKPGWRNLELKNEVRQRPRLLVGQHMSSIRDDAGCGIREQLLPFGRIARWNELVLLAPDHECFRCETIEPLREPPVWNRKEDLSCRTEPPRVIDNELPQIFRLREITRGCQQPSRLLRICEQEITELVGQH